MSEPTTQAYSGPVRGHAHLWFCSNPLPCDLGAPHDCSEARTAALAERKALVEALVEIRETARAPLSGYCQWCDARPDQTHQPDCPAALAMAALAKTPTKLAPSASPVKREALREAAIQYLASDGSHGLYDAGWMVRARHSLVALVGGVEPIEAAQDRMMTVYGEPIVPPAAALAEREAPVA